MLADKGPRPAQGSFRSPRIFFRLSLWNVLAIASIFLATGVLVSVYFSRSGDGGEERRAAPSATGVPNGSNPTEREVKSPVPKEVDEAAAFESFCEGSADAVKNHYDKEMTVDELQDYQDPNCDHSEFFEEVKAAAVERGKSRGLTKDEMISWLSEKRVFESWWIEGPKWTLMEIEAPDQRAKENEMLASSSKITDRCVAKYDWYRVTLVNHFLHHEAVELQVLNKGIFGDPETADMPPRGRG